MKIIDLAVHKVATIESGTSLIEGAKAMRALHVGSLVVIDDKGHPIGMLTDRDITIEVVALEKDSSKLTVDDVMSAPVRTANANETVIDALARMREEGIRRLPVVNDNNELCGIVTANNLVEEIAEMLESIVRAVKSSKTRETEQRP